MPLFTGDQLLAQKVVVSYWAQPILTKGGTALLAAPKKSLKSYFSLQLAEAIATGSDFLGWPTEKARVLYIDFENEVGEIKKRYIEIQRHYNKTRQIYFRTLDVKPISLDVGSNGHIELRELLKDLRPDVVFFDTFRKATHHEENSSTEMVKVFDSLTRLQQEFSFSAVIIHHMGKLGQFRAADSLDSVRGSTLILDHPNTIGLIEKLPSLGKDAPPRIDVHWTFRNHAPIDPWKLELVDGVFVKRKPPPKPKKKEESISNGLLKAK